MSRVLRRALSTSVRALEAAPITPAVTQAPPPASPTSSASPAWPTSAVAPAADGEAPAPSSSVVYDPEPVKPVKMRPKFTPKGKPIYTRLPRTTRVTLPNGFPEPRSYPVGEDYLRSVEAIRENHGGKDPKPHPLWSFFHVPEAAKEQLTPDNSDMPADFGTVPRMDNETTDLNSGRGWSAPELRTKSFEDLHILWYVLLRERNVLETQKSERKRLGIAPHYGGKLLAERANRCRKSMARIKYVLNERRLGAMAAGRAYLQAAGKDVLPESGATIPFALKNVNDPAAQVEALAGIAPIPTPVVPVKTKQKKTKAAKAAMVAEEDMSDAEIDALVAAEEEEARLIEAAEAGKEVDAGKEAGKDKN